MKNIIRPYSKLFIVFAYSMAVMTCVAGGQALASDTIIITWNDATLDAIRATQSLTQKTTNARVV
jgi:hypothetical protein